MKLKKTAVTHLSYSWQRSEDEILYYNGYEKEFYIICDGGFKNFPFTEIFEVEELSKYPNKKLLKDMLKFKKLVEKELSRRLVKGEINHEEKEIE